MSTTRIPRQRPRVLVIAEAANPEWVSVPLVGWSLSRALGEVADVHVLTHPRNRDALERAGWRQGREFTLIDSERVAGPIWRFDETLRRLTGMGWTVSTALSALPYYYFEHLVWQHFHHLLRAGSFDVVHRVTPLSPTTPSILARRCRGIGVPFVIGPLNGGVAWPADFAEIQRSEGDRLSRVRDAYKLLPGYRGTRSSAAAIIVASRATGEQLSAWSDRCVYIPENGIDPQRFRRRAAPPEPGQPLRVAFVGRLVPYKGADMLIEAAEPLLREKRLVLDIIGDGPEMPRLREMVRVAGVRGQVALDGWVPHELMQDRLSQSQVLGFPSVREFGGGVVLEAMALGLAPLVVDYAGPAELVTETTGLRVPVGPRAAVVAGVRRELERLASEPEMAAALGERARQRVLSLFTWSAKARQVLEVYRWVLHQRGKPDFGMPFPDQTVAEPNRSRAQLPVWARH